MTSARKEHVPVPAETRWSADGIIWKCLHKTSCANFNTKRQRKTLRKKRMKKGFSCRYIHKCKTCVFCFTNIMGGWCRPKSVPKGEVIWEWPSTSKKETKNKAKNKIYYTITITNGRGGCLMDIPLIIALVLQIFIPCHVCKKKIPILNLSTVAFRSLSATPNRCEH